MSSTTIAIEALPAAALPSSELLAVKLLIAVKSNCVKYAGCRMRNYLPRKPQNSDRVVCHLLSYRNDFIGKKFTVHEVGYREESDMLMLDVRGSTISHY